MEFRSELLTYLARRAAEGERKLPPMADVAAELGISVSKLREQLQVARALGWVVVRPHTGMQIQPPSPARALSLTMRYALALDRTVFDQIEELREYIEASYWIPAAQALTEADKQQLEALLNRAWGLLRDEPPQIPHREHRDLHLAIYARLENSFVRGFLEAYWDAYEIVGLNVYADYAYLENVWRQHERMVEGILEGDYQAGYRALLDHFEILHRRPGESLFATKSRPVDAAMEGKARREQERA